MLLKRLIFIFIVFLLSSFQSFAQTGDGTVPTSWLEGINPRTGKQVNISSVEFLVLVEPLSLHMNPNGTSTFTFDKVSGSTPNKRIRTWKLASEARNLINHAISNRQWLCLVYKRKHKGSLEDLSSFLSFSLIPYSFETEDSLGGPVPETIKPEWEKVGMAFSHEIKGDTITTFESVNMFALKNGNAYLVRGVTNDLFATKGSRDYLHIDNVPATALPFLRSLLSKCAGAFITYDKSTLKVYKMRLYKGEREFNKQVQIYLICL